MFKKVSLILALLHSLVLTSVKSIQAQTISVDGSTATIVTKDGNKITIDGNTLSGDGKNLFHSFQEFGLTQQQIATFLTNPQIQNILTRVTGGNPSHINGLIEVMGGNSNLFIMNPAGIVFGQGAMLNVPADFTATTATGIGFDSGVFNAVGSNDYQALVGNPNSFIFNTDQPGSIVNAGDLSLAENAQVSLIGGNVINTGEINTANGKILIEAVPGTSKVKISHEGSLISLELELSKDGKGNLLGFTPAELPLLLTGAKEAGVKTPEVEVNQATQRAEVAGKPIPSESGMVIVSGKLNVSGEGKGGDVKVLGNKVALIDGEIAADGSDGGGNVLVGGDFQGKGDIPQSQITFVDKESKITANATNKGDGGKVIVWAEGDTVFEGEIAATAADIEGDGGFVEVSGKENLGFSGNVDVSAQNGQGGTLLLDPENINIVADSINAPQDGYISSAPYSILAGDGGGADFTISEETLELLPGNVDIRLEANNNITIDELSSDGELSFATYNTNYTVTIIADADGDGAGSFQFSDTFNGNGSTSIAIATAGGNIDIQAANIDLNVIPLGVKADINSGGGDITLNALNSTTSFIDTGVLNTDSIVSPTFNPIGDITVNAVDSITAADVFGINVSLTSTTGSVATNTILGFDTVLGGNAIDNVVISAEDDIVTGDVEGDGISITSTAGGINTGLVDSGYESLTLNAVNEITTGNLYSDDIISVTSSAGGVTTELIDGYSVGVTSIGSNQVDVNAQGNVVTTDIEGDGVNIVSTSGTISTGNITSEYYSTTFGDNLFSPLNLSADGNVTSGNIEGDGITITSTNGGITTGSILNNIYLAGYYQSISVDLNAADDISSSYIRVPANVQIESDRFIKIGANISGSYSVESILGNISLTHGGGGDFPATPFIVGDNSVNGTSSSLISNSLSTSIETIAPVASFFDSYTSSGGTIEILTNLELPVVERSDGTETSVVTEDGGLTVDITQGTLSSDGDNLLHSFARFDLPESARIANFDVTANPAVQNILARVISGDASVINGTIQVTGGSPNLYFMNPAGIVFGSTAQLNVPADFLATTATGIGINGEWFSAEGLFNPNLLNGNPDSLAFTNAQPGAILNAANLNNTGNLDLLAGTQINTDATSSVNGRVGLVAIPGQSILNLSDFTITPASESPTLPNTFSAPVLSLLDLVNDAESPEGNSGELGLTPIENNVLQLNISDSLVTLGDVNLEEFVGGNDVTIIDSNEGIELNAIGVVSGDLLVRSLDGEITQSTSPSGNLTVLGLTTLDGNAVNDITLENDNDFNTVAIVGANNVTLNDINEIDLGLSAVDGNLDITSGGAITDSGSVNVLGTTILDVGIANDITLDDGNDFNTVEIVSGNNVILNDIDDIDLGLSNVDGNLQVTADGEITDSGDLTVLGTTILDAGIANNIILDNDNDFDTVGVVSANNVTLNDIDDIDLGFSIVNGNLQVTADGEVTNSGDLIILGTTSVDANGNDITLDENNDFNTVEIVSGNNVVLDDVNNIDLGLSNVDGDLDIATNGEITDSGSVTVLGTTILDANLIETGGAENITLDNDNDFNTVEIVSGNNVILNDINDIDLGLSNVDGDLEVTANGEVTDSGNVNVLGTTILDAGVANDITLDENNDFNTVEIVSGNNVTLNDVDDIDLGLSNVNGNLQITTNGEITDSGNVTVLGTTILDANLIETGDAENITLDEDNDFNTVEIVNGNNVILNDVDNIDLGLSNVDGDLELTANGEVTDSGNVNVLGTTILDAGIANDITLNNDNDFNTVEIVSGNNVSLNDVNNIDLGLSTVSGDLNVSSNGAITDSGDLTVAGTATLNTNTASSPSAFLNNITLDNDNDFNTVEIVSANNVILNDVDNIDIGLSTVDGDFNITSGGAITDSGNLTVLGTTIVDANGNEIVLDNENDFNVMAIIDASNATVNDVNSLNLQSVNIPGSLTISVGDGIVLNTINVGENLTVNAGGEISDGEESVITVGLTSSLQTPDNIILDNSNDFNIVEIVNGNNVTLNDINGIDLGLSTVNGNLSLTTQGTITDSGDLTVLGTTNINANGSDITLDSANNDFNTVGIVSGNNVSLNDENNIDLALSNVNGNLQVTTQGTVTDSGDLTVLGTTNINANGNDITLDSTNNDFNIVGIVSGNNVSLNDVNSLNLQGVNIPGDLTLNVGDGIVLNSLNVGGNLSVNAGGEISDGETGTITVGLNSTFQTPASIFLDNLTNNFNTLTANGVNLSVSDSNDISLNNLSVTNDLIITSEGNALINALINANSLTTQGNGTVTINTNSITTTNNQIYNNPLALQTNTNLVSQQGSVNFNNNVNAQGNNLTVSSDNAINFSVNGVVTSTGGDLLLQTNTLNRNISLSNPSENELVITNLNTINGFDQIAIATLSEENETTVESLTGTITIDTPLNVFDPLLLSAADIIVNQNINGNDNASITIRGDGSTTTLNADIITQGNEIVIDDNVVLGSDVTLATNNEGSAGAVIEINGNINGSQQLIMNSGENQIFVEGAIGNTQALESLVVTASTFNLNAELVNTINLQFYDADIILESNTTFNAQNDTFNSGNIDTFGNDISIFAIIIDTGNISTGNISTTGSIPVDGGDITLNTLQAADLFTPGAISTGNLNTSGQSAGNVTIQSPASITTGAISSVGETGNGGNVNLQADGDIQVSSINTRSFSQQGGNVDVSTTGRFRVTNTINESEVSIDSTGVVEGGSVNIDLFPGNLEDNLTEDARLPFIVGDASSNGTAGIITNSNFTIGQGQYFFTTTEGNLALRLLNQPVVEPPVVEPPVVEPPVVSPEEPPIEETPIEEPVEEVIEIEDPNPTNNEAQPPQELAVTVDINEQMVVNSVEDAQAILGFLEKQGAAKPALIYVNFTPKGYKPENFNEDFRDRESSFTEEYQEQLEIDNRNTAVNVSPAPSEDDRLDMLIVTSNNQPIRIVLPVTRKEVVEVTENLWLSLSEGSLNDDYKPYASQLHNWLIGYLEEELRAKEIEINNLVFLLPEDLRFMPIASLYDEQNQQFLVEKYSVGMAPSLNLNENTYRSIKDMRLLAMGASDFDDPEVIDLPGVNLELPLIRQIWGETGGNNQENLVDENFSFQNIKQTIDQEPYGIIHLGTHGEFQPGEIEESYIQLYSDRLGLNQIRELGLNDPVTELLVLSACKTAFGDENAELGFAGLAVQSGVKTALGSVWYVSDTGTLALMTGFYSQLRVQPTKAEALRQAQLDMIKGNIRKSEDGDVVITPVTEISLEGLPESAKQYEDLSHPFYWSPFTMIGNPW